MSAINCYSIIMTQSINQSTFCSETNAWVVVHTKGSIPKPRSRHSAVANGARIYVHGGVKVDSDLHVLDTGSKNAHSASHRGMVPLIVNCRRKYELDIEQIFCVVVSVTHTWSSISSSVFGFDSSLFGHTAHIHDDRMFLIGGKRAQTTIDSDQLVSLFDFSQFRDSDSICLLRVHTS
jgi:hypothetical protein